MLQILVLKKLYRLRLGDGRKMKLDTRMENFDNIHLSNYFQITYLGTFSFEFCTPIVPCIFCSWELIWERSFEFELSSYFFVLTLVTRNKKIFTCVAIRILGRLYLGEIYLLYNIRPNTALTFCA